jgi:hypothetical protein
MLATEERKMSSGNADIRTDADLRHWLVLEDWYMSNHTRAWLQRTPPEQAADTLARIAADADREPRSPWSVIATGIATAGFTPSGAIAGSGPVNRKAGVRAALMLANLNDLRCIAPLARAFAPAGSRQGQYQELIEKALTRVLANAEGQAETQPYEPEVQTLAREIWAEGGDGKDLSSAHAELLIAALRFLKTAGADLSVLNAIVKAPAKKPSRSRVKETARALLAL